MASQKESWAQKTVKYKKQWNMLVEDCRANYKKFAIVMTLQALVYFAFGTENSLLPNMARSIFGQSGNGTTLVTLVMYGVFKAIGNVTTPWMNEKFGRHNTHRMGWVVLACNPWMIIYAQNWETIVGAYVLLGLSQGWQSGTDNQFVQQLIPNSQGFALGVYETVSYCSLALGVLFTGYISKFEGDRPGPQHLCLGTILIGFLLMMYIPTHDPKAEAAQDKTYQKQADDEQTAGRRVWWRIVLNVTLTRRVPALSCFAAVMVQIAVGLAWTLMPVYWRELGLVDKVAVASIQTLFNAIRGVLQVFCGPLSDFIGGKTVVVCGFGLCGAGFILSAAIPTPGMDLAGLISLWLGCAALLGIGVACIYPVVPAELGKNFSAAERDMAVAVFRWWRELGYAFGGIISIGILEGGSSVGTCVIIIGIMMLATSAILALFYGDRPYALWLFWRNKGEEDYTQKLQQPAAQPEKTEQPQTTASPVAEVTSSGSSSASESTPLTSAAPATSSSSQENPAAVSVDASPAAVSVEVNNP